MQMPAARLWSCSTLYVGCCLCQLGIFDLVYVWMQPRHRRLKSRPSDRKERQHMFRTLHKARKSIASWWLAAERRKGGLPAWL